MECNEATPLGAIGDMTDYLAYLARTTQYESQLSSMAMIVPNVAWRDPETHYLSAVQSVLAAGQRFILEMFDGAEAARRHRLLRELTNPETTLDEWLEGKEAKGFAAVPHYFEDGDYINFFLTDERCHAKQCGNVTVYHSDVTGAVVGFKIMGIHNVINGVAGAACAGQLSRRMNSQPEAARVTSGTGSTPDAVSVGVA